MKLITIEEKVFEELLSRFENFVGRIDNLCRLYQDNGLEKWLDNQDVCLLLNVSLRSLQTFRDNGTLPFSRIENKIYYHVEDVKTILEIVKEKQKHSINQKKK